MPSRSKLRAVFLLLGASVSIDAFAAEPSGAAASAPPLPSALEACARTRVDAERLACYDQVVAPQVRGGAEAPGAAASAPSTAAQINAGRPQPLASDNGSYLDEFWELTSARKHGTFNFTGYRPNYFFPVHQTTGLNRHPDSPAAGHAGTLPGYHHLEAKLQISVRTKLAEDLLLPNADLWFAYTQQSLWQIYSGGISRPFRATDHEPELIYIVPASFELPLGFRTRMAGLGLAHQSNGQALPLSRSWNRLYALGGIENGDVALTARYNWRIHERDGQDDNPDFTHYRGRTELLALWGPGFYTLSALAKTNFDSRGSLQLDFTMPVRRRDPKGLRWYAQVFSGYGETLIDYNFRQTSFGAGVTLFGW
jgi:phospholipase A1